MRRAWKTSATAAAGCVFALYRAGREWEFYDASAPGDPRVIAYGAGEVADQVSDPTLWATVVRQWST